MNDCSVIFFYLADAAVLMQVFTSTWSIRWC